MTFLIIFLGTLVSFIFGFCVGRWMLNIDVLFNVIERMADQNKWKNQSNDDV